MPTKFHQPINFKQYGKMLEEHFLMDTMDSTYELASNTFFCGVYLPSAEHEVAVHHPEMPGIFYMKFNMPHLKHLSINSMSIPQKRIRKVKEVRKWELKKSVLKNFTPDTDEVINAAFESDKGSLKIKKFIKDQQELDKTYKILRKNFVAIKNQFVNMISRAPDSYPQIDWLDFVNICGKRDDQKTWDIMSKELKSTDIDVIFIATNYEEGAGESDNDGDSLCRYEFFEIICRMAQCKFFTKNKEVVNSVSEAIEKMIDEFIIPNSVEMYEYQGFRDKYLWNLDVEDMLVANTVPVSKLYTLYATEGSVGRVK